LIRRPAVAGSWYPRTRSELTDAVDRYLAAARDHAAVTPRPDLAEVIGLIAPHAGLMYSGAVAAFAYAQIAADSIDTAIMVGPSHFVAFDGVSIYPRGGFDTPLGVAEVDEACATALMTASSIIHELPAAHTREHALEMQLPFFRRVAPQGRIVPLIMGEQTTDTIQELGRALGTVREASARMGRRVVLVASTDLSHYHDAATAALLDEVVIDHVARLDADGLQASLLHRPDHACGGGPAVSVLLAARQQGARSSVILKYADSGDVSGDKTSVVGYLAAAFGRAESVA
jgi:AmmeMemoRadiSam system protein B